MLSGTFSLSIFLAVFASLALKLLRPFGASLFHYELKSSCLLMVFAVPVSVYILSLPLPYLPEATSLSPFFLLGCGVLVCGLYLYNTTRPARNSSEID